MNFCLVRQIDNSILLPEIYCFYCESNFTQNLCEANPRHFYPKRQEIRLVIVNKVLLINEFF